MRALSYKFLAQSGRVVSLALVVAAGSLSIAALLDRSLLGPVTVPLLALSVCSMLLLLAMRDSRAKKHLEQQADDLRQKVREAEERNRWLKLTEANAHIGHWRLDLVSNEVYWSDETFRIHGLKVGDHPSLDEAIRFYHPEDRSIVADAVEGARTTGEPFTFRARILRNDGAIRYVETVARLEYGKEDRPLALFGVLADRTPEEAMQCDLRDARDEARAMAEAKSAFLAKMSHEIRNPMNGVLGFIDLLMCSNLTPLQQRHASLIAESGRNLQTILNDILDLSKIEAGRMQVFPKPTNLSKLIRSATRLAEPMAREKALQLVCEIDQGLPTNLIIDPIRLRQIISNLLTNAVRFTDRGRIALSARESEGRLEIAVSDNGIGIETILLESIFDAFSMVDPADVHGRGGTGLGLPICRQLAELMGGTISVESEISIGSRFIVRLPLISAGVRLIENEETERHQNSATMTMSSGPILLAEDFDINRELVAEMAKRLGLELHLACDGVEAVAMVRRASDDGRPYSLVLMDMQMPLLDGCAATRLIREAGFDAKNLPILALTANAFAEDVLASKEAGMQEHLAKPLCFETFCDAMERWLPIDRSNAA